MLLLLRRILKELQQTIKNYMELLHKLNWRYATKSMNGNVVPEEKVERILEAARLAATSSGLQPFEIIVVKNKELK